MVLALVAGRLDFRVLQETLENTTRLTSMVMFLLIGSNAFTLIFREFGGDAMVRELLESLPGGYLGALILINLVIFVLGFFLDFFEISFIVVPILAPQFLGLYDVHPAWFGVMIALNLQTSFLTPPFGFALFYLKGVCPESIRTTQIYQGVVPFIVMQLLTLALVIAFPQIVTWLV